MNYETQMIKYWTERAPFKDENDVYDIPVVSEEVYKNIIIPNIIRCGGIPKNKLKEGAIYIGSCRNASEAIWNGHEFVYARTKFGNTYPEKINHFEDDDGYDLFVPIKEKDDV